METEARCLDGSPCGFYFRQSSSNNARWSISIEGGGWCYNETLCYSRSKGPIGSSKHWAHAGYCGCRYHSPDGTAESDCNCAYLPYGDGASFAGYRKNSFPVAEWPGLDNHTHPVPGNATLYFRGIRNLDSVIDVLFQKYNLVEAKEMVVTGGSAGGLSTFLHMVRVAGRFGQAGEVPSQSSWCSCDGVFPGSRQ